MYVRQVHQSTLRADRLRASEQICAGCVELGSFAWPATRLAELGSVSLRTFHRYFATRAEVVAPLFLDASDTVNAYVANARADSTRDLLTGAHESMFGGARAGFTSRLFPLVLADPQLTGVFLRALHDGEAALHPVLASRAGLSDTAPSARALSSAFTAANRIALERMSSESAPRLDVFTEMMSAFAPLLPSLPAG